MAITIESIKEAVEGLKSLLPVDFKPEIGIIGGSGLSALEDAVLEPRWEVPYGKIKGFPVSTVPGHAGKLVFGHVGKEKTPTVLMAGRAHYYEGHELQTATFPIRVLALLGMKTLIVTNAAGGLNSTYKVGDVVVLHDHINFAGLSGVNPLRGPNLDDFGPRFIALSDAYDLELRRAAHLAWKDLSKDRSKQMVMHEGVYAFVGGPNYETRAECRMLSTLGADLVGMSTVPEIIVARHSGVRVLAMSLVTNVVVMDPGPRGDAILLAESNEAELSDMLKEGKADHEDVLEASRNAAQEIKNLIVKIVEVEASKKR
ncbi:purine nucleoside phosphorylase I, inosine and guanosine-specific [Stipitochalara longipes BDJ]|nr:purine nucleoside phosphorylase I, inosine and guanosine-specific [Stipitochalara longipes BDJ]